MLLYLLQIETVGPESKKLLWLVLILIAIGITVFLSKKKFKLKLPHLKSVISVDIQKNKIYHPSVVHIAIVNKTTKAIIVQNPVLRFRRGRKTKAYKITSVKTKDIYPLYLEANKTHNLPVTLQAFYDHYKRLKRYSRLRVEFKYDDNRRRRSKYVLLKPTLFRKEK